MKKMFLLLVLLSGVGSMQAAPSVHAVPLRLYGVAGETPKERAARQKRMWDIRYMISSKEERERMVFEDMQKRFCTVGLLPGNPHVLSVDPRAGASFKAKQASLLSLIPDDQAKRTALQTKQEEYDALGECFNHSLSVPLIGELARRRGDLWKEMMSLSQDATQEKVRRLFDLLLYEPSPKSRRHPIVSAKEFYEAGRRFECRKGLAELEEAAERLRK